MAKTKTDAERDYWVTYLGKTGSLASLRFEGYGTLGGTGKTVSDRERSYLGGVLGLSDTALAKMTLGDLRTQHRLATLSNEALHDTYTDLEYKFWSGTGFAPGAPAIDGVTKAVWISVGDISPAQFAAGSFVDKTGTVTVTQFKPSAVNLVAVVDAAANNQKYVTFADTDNTHMRMPLSALGICDIWLVVRGVNVGSSWKFGNDTTQLNHATFSNNIYDDILTTTRTDAMVPPAAFNTACSLYRCKNTVVDGRNIWVNNTNISSTAGSTPVMVNPSFIGGSSTDGAGMGSSWSGGRFYELIGLTPANSTAPNIAIIKTYLNTKYGLTLS